MESQIIAYYNPNFQSQSRAARPADSLMGVIGENVEITRLKEQVARLESELAEVKQVEEDQAELIREWEGVGLSAFGEDTPDDSSYRIQELFDDNESLREQVDKLEEECEELEGALKEQIDSHCERLSDKLKPMVEDNKKWSRRVDELEEELAAEKEQRRLDNEKAREVIQSCCNENKQLKDVMGDIDKFVLHQQEILEKEGYVFDSEKGEWKWGKGRKVEKPTPTRVKDLLEIDDGYLADVESAVREVLEERGTTIIDGDAPKMTRSGKCY
tara:strand:- start:5725 stop:6540 length:816 start_codon:yes stop_codon:yes gene_type:complete